MVKQKKDHYDVTVVGGGMVGATLACALATLKLKVVVLEALDTPPIWSADQISLRVSAISGASKRIFQNIGIWDALEQKRVSPYRDMHVWDSTGSGVIHFDCAEVGTSELGYIIENELIQSTLWEKCQKLRNIEMITGDKAHFLDLQNEPLQARLDLTSGRSLFSKLIVAADGGNSWVRKQSGIHVTSWSDNLKAVVCTVRTENHHQETAWQCFLPTGPIAFLPLLDGFCSIVWSTTTQMADWLVTLNDEEFMTELQKRFGTRLGKIETTSRRAAFPLKLQYAENYVKTRLALVGDAAHTILPLAGQGVNLGLLDAATLVQVVEQSIMHGRDFGSFQNLRPYERWRKGENLAMVSAMNGFHRLFGSNFPLIRWGRNLGLNVTNKIPAIKYQFVRRAMGLQGDVPKLASQQ